jgi:hypothetical protein
LVIILFLLWEILVVVKLKQLLFRGANIISKGLQAILIKLNILLLAGAMKISVIFQELLNAST